MRYIRLLLVVSFLLCSCRTADRSADPSNTKVIEAYFSPGGGCTDAIVRELSHATASIRIQAYSFTSAPIAKAIIEAGKRGVKVEAVLDKSNYTEHYSGATTLKNQGCEVRIDCRHAIAHNKVIIIDDKTILTGSFNFTGAAETSNAENLLVIRDNPPLVQKYVANFKLHQKHSEPYRGLAGSAATEENPENTAKAKFVGNKNSSVYHYPNCTAVKNIKPANLVQYDAPPPGKRLHEGCPK